MILFKIISATKTKNNPQNKLFERSRWQLAIWYAGILSLVLGICGVGIYQAIAYSQRLTVDRELEAIANSIHEVLEPILQEPGQFKAVEAEIAAKICSLTNNCQDRQIGIESHLYYITLSDTRGHQLTTIGNRHPGFLNAKNNEEWQDIQDIRGNNYRKIALILHNQNFENWGYLQIARSLGDVDRYLNNLRWMLLMGFPAGILLLMFVSWWLSGLAMRPIYQSYQLLQQFTADAAHELNTPLAATRATVESILMMPNFSEAEARETLQTLRRQNLRVSNLVSNLLLLCRMDRQLSINSDSEKRAELVSVNQLVEDITEDFAALALASEIELKIDNAIDSYLIVSGNYEQLYRLLSNLLVNALKYTPANGIVTLILDRHSNYALLKVCDTGIGIAKSEQSKIFNRFYRIDSARSRSTGGSGLGLSIAQVIAQSHRGKIEVESELDRGSTFIIWLPISK